MDRKTLYRLAKEITLMEIQQKQLRTKLRQTKALLNGADLDGEGTLAGRVQTYLQSRNGSVQVKEIAEGVGGKKPSVNAALFRLEKQGLISRDGRGYYSKRAS